MLFSACTLYSWLVNFLFSQIQAEEILANSQADMVLIAREFLRNPFFPQRAAQDLDVDLSWAPQYNRGKEGKKKPVQPISTDKKQQVKSKL
jgi:2,4-dienoyl-CoA reductase-like NADH-dependent reductase (Old Yellow Enzyme family)